MPSPEVSAAQPVKHDHRSSRFLSTRQTTLEVSRTVSSSPSDSQDSTSATNSNIPDDPDGRVHMIAELKGRNIILLDRCMRWRGKCNIVEARMQKAEADHGRSELKMIKQQQWTKELESLNQKLAEAAAEAESKLKQEQEKVHKLRLEYDCLQQDLSQKRLMAKEENRFTERTLDNFNDLVESFARITIKDFIADVERAFARLEGSRDNLLRDSDRLLRQDRDVCNNIRKSKAPERLRESPKNATNPTINRAVAHTTEGTISASPQRDVSTPSTGRKRGLENTNAQPVKRVKAEVEEDGNAYDQGEKERKETGRSASIPSVSVVDRTQHESLDPRPMALARRHLASVIQK